LEEDAKEPTSAEDRRALQKRNTYQYDYGHGKVRCECALKDAASRNPFPYVALRLPDVIGPYDNIGSLLELQQALQRSEQIGLRIACGKKKLFGGSRCGSTHRISLVYAVDVATAVLAVVRAAAHEAKIDTTYNKSAVIGQTMNIAMAEQPTYREFVQLVANIVREVWPSKSAEAARMRTGGDGSGGASGSGEKVPAKAVDVSGDRQFSFNFEVGQSPPETAASAGALARAHKGSHDTGGDGGAGGGDGGAGSANSSSANTHTRFKDADECLSGGTQPNSHTPESVQAVQARVRFSKSKESGLMTVDVGPIDTSKVSVCAAMVSAAMVSAAMSALQ
jgi:hypothetical protein